MDLQAYPVVIVPGPMESWANGGEHTMQVPHVVCQDCEPKTVRALETGDLVSLAVLVSPLEEVGPKSEIDIFAVATVAAMTEPDDEGLVTIAFDIEYLEI